MQNNIYRKRRIGFTLIELMVVLLLLSIIVAVATPVFTKKRKAEVESAPVVSIWGRDNTVIFDNNNRRAQAEGNYNPTAIGINPTAYNALKTAEYNGDANLFVHFHHPALIINNSSDLPIFNSAQLMLRTKEGDGIFSASHNAGRLSFDNFRNMAIGNGALENNRQAFFIPTENYGNIAIGSDAMRTPDTIIPNGGREKSIGMSNIAIGSRALGNALRGGVENIAIGSDAMRNAFGNDTSIIDAPFNHDRTTGRRNIAIGNGAMTSNARWGNSAWDNIAIGYEAMHAPHGIFYEPYLRTYPRDDGTQDETEGDEYGERTDRGRNIAIGYRAMFGNEGLIQGNQNIAIGQEALFSLTTGSNNIAVGTNALRRYIGGQYLNVNSEDDEKALSREGNIAIGLNAMNSANLTDDVDKIVSIGTGSLQNAREAVGAVVIGNYAAQGSSVTKSVVVGNYSATNSTIENDTILGNGINMVNNSSNNVVAGFNAQSNGSRNVVAGFDAGNGAQNDNVAIGGHSLAGGNSNKNVAIGYGSLNSISSGMNSNVAIGYSAMGNVGVSSSDNVVVGSYAGYRFTGSKNVIMGYNAAKESNSLTETVLITPNTTTGGSKSVVIGAGASGGTGEGNLIVGANAGKSSLGSNNFYIGYRAGSSGSSVTSNGSCIGYNCQATTQNTMFLTTSGTMWFTSETLYNYRGANASFGTPSDRRLKNIGGKSTKGIKELRKINVYEYAFKKEPTKQLIGVVAQEVKKVIPKAVSKDGEYYSLNIDPIFYAMINAIKDVDKAIEVKKAELKKYCSEFKVLLAKYKKLKQEIEVLVKENIELRQELAQLDKRLKVIEAR